MLLDARVATHFGRGGLQGRLHDAVVKRSLFAAAV